MTKEKAITIIESHKAHWQRLLREKICDDTEGREAIESFDMAILSLKDEWIPTEEREPDLMDEVLLSLRSLEVVKGWKSETLFHGERCYYICGSGDYVVSDNVLAWMLKPEPYKKGE